jgi:hypothetical protein
VQQFNTVIGIVDVAGVIVARSGERRLLRSEELREFD